MSRFFHPHQLNHGLLLDRLLMKHHNYGNVHMVEKLCQFIEIWNAASAYLQQEMNHNFRMIDPFNSVHMMNI